MFHRLVASKSTKLLLLMERLLQNKWKLEYQLKESALALNLARRRYSSSISWRCSGNLTST